MERERAPRAKRGPDPEPTPQHATPHDEATEKSSSRGPWHAGEVALQRIHGVDERMGEIGRRVIRDHMPAQHRAFFEGLAYLFLGTIDPEGRPWAGARFGEPGALRSPDPRSLLVGMPASAGDPVDAGLRDGAPVGLLGLDLATQRRNRVNGRATEVDASGRFHLAVEQSFGNCRRFIRRRALEVEPRATTRSRWEGTHLDEACAALVARCDTCFVASYAETDDGRSQQVDVSHRGGPRGFARVGDDGVLHLPDYSGNLFFSTLGNILVTGRAGLTFLDFERGDLLQVSGRAEVTNPTEPDPDEDVVHRWWVRPEMVILHRGALPSFSDA